MKAILLFSGGRDSTLAALKLTEEGYDLSLLTVKATHLKQYDQIERRFAELQKHIIVDLDSYVAHLNNNTSEDNCIFTDVCLDCQALFLLSALHLSKTLGINTICTGYTGYQDRLPEQANDSITALKKYVFSPRKIKFLTPVYDIHTKEDVIRSLGNYTGISTDALEQKCSIRPKGAIHPVLKKGEIIDWAQYINKADHNNCLDEILNSLKRV